MEKQEVEVERKSSLCRFYVRGLCIFNKEQCRFSHGIDDIDYHYWQPDEPVETDYLQDTDFCQKKAIKGPRVYKDLYEFQTVKKYTLEELNQNRPLRTQVRGQMHKQLFLDFIQLLQNKFPQANLTEAILMRQYTRAGFNKLMTRIKFSHLTSYLCDSEDSKYLKQTLVVPPSVKRETSFIVRKASQDEIIETYRNQYIRIMKEATQPLQQAVIKKMMFQMALPSINIPLLSHVLKEKRISFTEFLLFLNGDQNADKLKMQPSIQEIFIKAKQYLFIESKSKLINWNDLYIYLSKQLKINNGNTINQIKPKIIIDGYKLLYFPMIQFIYNTKSNYPFEEESFKLCPCKYKDQYQNLKLNQNTIKLNSEQSVDINNLTTIQQYAIQIINSKILAVDLEGSLRKGGFVQMIQLNNGKNTFLIDIYSMQQNQYYEAIQLTKKVLRNVFVDPLILKIFHDSRHDSLALHLFMQTCIVNVFDTSATETVRTQFQNYEQLNLLQNQDKQVKVKNVILECTKIKTPGLNDILKRYKASHGINQNKQRFHQMWSQGEVKFFCQRPIHPDYREYCIKDVLDLPQIQVKMQEQLSKEMLSMSKWLSAHYVSFGFQKSE